MGILEYGVISMRLKKWGIYGVMAVIILAAAPTKRPISVKKIARERDISSIFLEQILNKLRRAEIVGSARGPRGGFFLNRKPHEISVKDILGGVGESVYPTPCADPEERKRCPQLDDCIVSAMWLDFPSVINKYLSGITIKDIMDKGSIKYHENPTTDQDFSISVGSV